MTATARVTPIQESKAITLFDLSESVFKEIETYQGLEIVDSKTETDVRQARVAVRDIRYKIQRRHKELNSDLNQKKKDYKAMAESLIERLLPTENNLDEKIKAVEAVAEAAKAEKMAAEKARTDAILSEITRMENITATAQEYGLPSPRVQELLSDLEAFPVKPEFFEEFTDNALAAKKRDIEIVQACLDRTLKFEADQKAQAEIEAANKAEADRLAKIAAEQEKARKEAEAAQAKADAEARAEREAEAAKMAAERKALDEAKAKAEAEEKARAESESKRMAELERREQEIEWAEYAAEIDRRIEADKVAFQARVDRCIEIGVKWYEADLNEAHEENKRIDGKRAVLAESLKSDKQKLIEFGKMLSQIKAPELTTDYGQDLAKDISRSLKNICETITEQLARIK